MLVPLTLYASITASPPPAQVTTPANPGRGPVGDAGDRLFARMGYFRVGVGPGVAGLLTVDTLDGTRADTYA